MRGALGILAIVAGCATTAPNPQSHEARTLAERILQASGGRAALGALRGLRAAYGAGPLLRILDQEGDAQRMDFVVEDQMVSVTSRDGYETGLRVLEPDGRQRAGVAGARLAPRGGRGAFPAISPLPALPLLRAVDAGRPLQVLGGAKQGPCAPSVTLFVQDADSPRGAQLDVDPTTALPRCVTRDGVTMWYGDHGPVGALTMARRIRPAGAAKDEGLIVVVTSPTFPPRHFDPGVPLELVPDPRIMLERADGDPDRLIHPFSRTRFPAGTLAFERVKVEVREEARDIVVHYASRPEVRFGFVTAYVYLRNASFEKHAAEVKAEVAARFPAARELFDGVIDLEGTRILRSAYDVTLDGERCLSVLWLIVREGWFVKVRATMPWVSRKEADPAIRDLVVDVLARPGPPVEPGRARGAPVAMR